MAMIPYSKKNWLADPFGELESLQREMNKLFNTSISHPWQESTLLGGQWAPDLDIFDSKENILVKADLPGLSKDDIEISVQDNVLMIKGDKKKDEQATDEHYFKTERFYGSFCRTVQLPAGIDTDHVDAAYQDGVLTLTMPKREEAKPKQISINVK